MIFGIGTDIIEVQRVEKLVGSAAGRKRIFSESEIAYCESKKNKGENYAEGLQEKYDGFIASMTAKYDSLMHQTEALATNGKARYEEAKKEVKNFNV